MGTCSVDKCNKKDFQDGFCTVHMPKKAAVGATAYNMVLARAKGVNTVNVAFSALAATSTPNEPYKQRIEHLRSVGPSSGGEEMVHNVSCLHDTQKANNVTVWYSWSGNTITIWGLGSHSGGSGAGNKKYSMTWFDGTNKNWTRKNSPS